VISQELLDILVCPEDRTPLRAADAALVERLNRAIAAGKIVNRAGSRVERQVAGALVRQDGTLAYQVTEGFPIMLADEAIPLAQLDEAK
jgi:uncharacterized protein YbaR (Trm112 family)